MRSTTVTRRAETDHRSCSGGPAPGPRSMLRSRLCGSLPDDPSLTPTGLHEPPSGQPRSPCFTLRPGANRLVLAPTDQMACHSCAIASTGDRARPVTTGAEPTELKLRDLLLSQSVPRVQPLQGRGSGFESRRLHPTFPQVKAACRDPCPPRSSDPLSCHLRATSWPERSIGAGVGRRVVPATGTRTGRPA